MTTTTDNDSGIAQSVQLSLSKTSHFHKFTEDKATPWYNHPL